MKPNITEERKIQINKFLMKASREMLRSRDPTDQYCLLCTEMTEKFCIDTIARVIRRWVELDKGGGKLPTAKELVNECKEFDGYHEKKMIPSDLELQCKYFSANESIESKSLCGKILSEEQMNISIIHYGALFCKWHQSCIYAKQFLNSTTNMFVKETLKLKRYTDGMSNEEVDNFIKSTKNSLSVCLKNIRG